MTFHALATEAAAVAHRARKIASEVFREVPAPSAKTRPSQPVKNGTLLFGTLLFGTCRMAPTIRPVHYLIFLATLHIHKLY
ncbi:MAG: hypothetical protein ACLGI6_05665 [Gammaproteobacteria bacterium]